MRITTARKGVNAASAAATRSRPRIFGSVAAVALIAMTGSVGVGSAIASDGDLGSTDAASDTNAATVSLGLDPFVCRTYTHRAVGNLSDPALNEVSGMARGRRDTSVLWVHEDSGAKADVHALTLTGQSRQTFRLTGVTAKDWEDMDVGPGPQAGVNYLYLGDIGDNGKNRANITINRVPEPGVTGPVGITNLAGTQQIVARYPDGAHNAEAMAVGADGTIYVITKETTTKVYAIPYPQSTTNVITMTKVAAGTLGPKTDVSGADIRPDGRALIVRGYRNAWTWPINLGEPMATSLARTPCLTNTYRDEKQGEAIGFLGDDGSYMSTGEQVNAVVRQYTL